MAHLFMSAMDVGPTFYYPDQSASPAATYYNATTTSGDSDFAGGSEDAIIYSLVCTVASTSLKRVVLQTATGVPVAELSPSGNAPSVLDFGPDGLRVPGGFRVNVTTAVAELTIVYDRVSSNA